MKYIANTTTGYIITVTLFKSHITMIDNTRVMNFAFNKSKLRINVLL